MPSLEQNLSSILSVLGRSSIDSDRLEKESESPAVKKLLEWLTSQVLDDDCHSLQVAALKDITLEPAEVESLKHNNLDLNVAAGAPSVDYELPSETSARVRYMNEEAALLEAEADLLKHRAHQTKIACQHQSQLLKSMEANVDAIDKRLRDAQAVMGETSIKSDVTLSASSQAAHNLINTLTSSPLPTTTLFKLSEAHLSAVQSTEMQLRRTDAMAAHLPTVPFLEVEAQRLLTAFRLTGTDRSLAQTTEDAVYRAELIDLCRRLDTGETTIVTADTPNEPAIPKLRDVDVKREIEAAWRADQYNVAQMQNALFDQTIASLTALVPPLQSMYHTLSSTNTYIRDAEAILGALAEEVEETTDDVNASKSLGDPPCVADADQPLFTDLVSLLKSNKESRPPTAPPLILLDHQDVLTELTRLIHHCQSQTHQETAWTSTLRRRLAEISHNHTTPLLTTIYAHSPTHTSRPFGPPDEVRSVEEEARSEGEGLCAVVSRLEAEMDGVGTGKALKKLDGFVDKWGGGGKAG